MQTHSSSPLKKVMQHSTTSRNADFRAVFHPSAATHADRSCGRTGAGLCLEAGDGGAGATLLPGSPHSKTGEEVAGVDHFTDYVRAGMKQSTVTSIINIYICTCLGRNV